MQTTRDEILGYIREVFGKFWRVAVDDGGQLREHVRVHLGWIWVMAESHFDHRETKRPDVRRDRVRANVVLRLASDTLGLFIVSDEARCEMDANATYSHITLASNVRLRQRLLELPRDPKIAQLDLPLSVHENICRFDVCSCL